jgi:hypothetical protein
MRALLIIKVLLRILEGKIDGRDVGISKPEGSKLVGRLVVWKLMDKVGILVGAVEGKEGLADGKLLDAGAEDRGASTLVIVRVICVQPFISPSLPLKALAPQIWMVMVVPR